MDVNIPSSKPCLYPESLFFLLNYGRSSDLLLTLKPSRLHGVETVVFFSRHESLQLRVQFRNFNFRTSENQAPDSHFNLACAGTIIQDKDSRIFLLGP